MTSVQDGMVLLIDYAGNYFVLPRERLVLVDEERQYYRVPRETLERARVPVEQKPVVEQLVGAAEVTGFGYELVVEICDAGSDEPGVPAAQEAGKAAAQPETLFGRRLIAHPAL